MKDKKERDKDRGKLSENNYDTNPPTEFIDSVNRKSKSIPLDEEDAIDKKLDEDLEKFKRGELGAEHFRYNDDGSPEGTSRKLDIDIKSDTK